MIPNRIALTVAEVGAALGLPASAVDGWVRAGQLPAASLAGALLIRVDAVEAFLLAHEGAQPARGAKADRTAHGAADGQIAAVVEWMRDRGGRARRRDIARKFRLPVSKLDALRDVMIERGLIAEARLTVGYGRPTTWWKVSPSL